MMTFIKRLGILLLCGITMIIFVVGVVLVHLLLPVQIIIYFIRTGIVLRYEKYITTSYYRFMDRIGEQLVKIADKTYYVH